MSERLCSLRECSRPLYCKGFCRVHYTRWAKHGDPHVNNGTKGGIRKHPLYGAWAGMINRCHNPNNSAYHRYGGRGIYVCDRWRKDFRNFLADMGERPAGKTLDRMDGNGPYSPGNCRWATSHEQRANITPKGDEMMRAAMSKGVKRRWAEWRAAGNVPKPKHPKTPRSRHEKVCAVCGAPFVSVRSDARQCSAKCNADLREARKAAAGIRW